MDTQFIITIAIEGDLFPRRGRRCGQPLGDGDGEAGYEGVAQVLLNTVSKPYATEF